MWRWWLLQDHGVVAVAADRGMVVAATAPLSCVATGMRCARPALAWTSTKSSSTAAGCPVAPQLLVHGPPIKCAAARAATLPIKMAAAPPHPKPNCKRILFVDYGTRDDISPTLAVALAAHNDGHDVAFVTNQEHQELVSTYGVKFSDGCAVAWGDLYSKESDAMLAGSSLNMFSEMVSSYLGHWHATELRTLNCIKRGFDLVVGTQWTSVIATGVARRLKIPVALLQGAPLTPTRAWPCIYMGQGQGLFGFTNTLSFDMASKLWWRLKGPTYITWQVSGCDTEFQYRSHGARA